jgi:hypothetical protein
MEERARGENGVGREGERERGREGGEGGERVWSTHPPAYSIASMM